MNNNNNLGKITKSHKSNKICKLKKFIKNSDEKIIECKIAGFYPENICIEQKYKYLFDKIIFSNVYSYISLDPTIKVLIDDLETTISYIYKNKLYKNRIPYDTNKTIINNILFLHDYIFGHLLKEYEVIFSFKV